MRGVFVTGTDTDCGKTVVAGGLLRVLSEAGRRAAGFKPVAAGAQPTPLGLRNEDALALQAESVAGIAYEDVNPLCYAPAIAPHIAAAESGRPIRFAVIREAHDRLAARVDSVVAEGAGGWRVPLGDDGDMADLAALLGYPVVLVVGLRLGCLNHALLSADSIRSRGLRLLGWVGSALDPGMARRDENLATLRETLPAPCLGVVPRLTQPDPRQVARALDGFRAILGAETP
jgi:dethiobiotin synthetase